MRKLFVLLLIYFLTGILQIAGNSIFINERTGYTSANDTGAFDCIVSPEMGMFESILENIEDQDNETATLLLSNTIPDILQNNTIWIEAVNTNHLRKELLIHYTNLPPPSFCIPNHSKQFFA